MDTRVGVLCSAGDVTPGMVKFYINARNVDGWRGNIYFIPGETKFMRHMDREEGSAAVIYLYVTGILAIVFVWIILNPEVDTFIGIPQLGILSYSSDLMTSMRFTQTMYDDFLIVFLLLWTVAAYIAALRARSQAV